MLFTFYDHMQIIIIKIRKKSLCSNVLNNSTLTQNACIDICLVFFFTPEELIYINYFVILQRYCGLQFTMLGFM